jgi:phosphoesterase RecJ-like protein
MAACLQGARRVLITGHSDPDGDVAGGCSALYCALRQLGKEPTLYNPDPYPPGYRHLPGAHALVHTLAAEEVFDATVILDAARPDRVELYLPPREKRGTVLWIDHHPRQGPSGDLEWIDEDASAMGEMLFTLLGRMGKPVDVEVGMGLYATLIADTGGFRYESTTSTALNLAARLVDLGVKPWDVAEQVFERQPLERVRLLSRVLGTLRVGKAGRFACVSLLLKDLKETGTTTAMSDGMINHARGIDGVEMAAQLEELEAQRWRVTLRSRGGMEAGAVAARLGERGHRFGAKFVLEGAEADVAARLERAVDDVAAGA